MIATLQSTALALKHPRGFDKIVKFIQYLAKLSSYLLVRVDFGVSSRLNNLSKHLKRCRRMPRLFKAVGELAALSKVFPQTCSSFTIKLIWITYHCLYACHWTLDNLVDRCVLSSILNCTFCFIAPTRFSLWKANFSMIFS